MEISYSERAQVLIEALPYIQNYANKTIVIKFGGSAMDQEELCRAVIADIILLKLVGINVVMIHSGSTAVKEMLEKAGKEIQLVNGFTYTDEETMDIAQMVICGKVNKTLVSMLNRSGASAVGLSGMDGDMIQAVRKAGDGVDYGLVGEITSINPRLIEDTMEKGFIPVISAVAQGLDADTSYVVNPNIAATKIAVALKAEKLILLTDVCGLLRDKDDDASLISQIRLSEVPLLIREGKITGTMVDKVNCCVEAVRSGVPRAHILNGGIRHSLLIEILTHAGSGTMIL